MRNKLPLMLLVAMSLSGNLFAGAGRQSPELNPSDTTRAKTDYPVMNYSQPKTYVVDKVSVHGIYVMDVEEFAGDMGIMSGDTIVIPGNYVTGAVNKIMARQQFSGVDIVAVPHDEYVDLEIHITQQPLVRNWDFAGIRKGQANDLKKKMNLKQGSQLSDYDINNHKKFIRNYYKEKGFRNADVNIRVVNDPEMPQFVNVTFVVDRNDKVKIGKIDFHGNDNFSDRRLRRTMKNTHQTSINIFRSAKFKDKEYGKDKDEVIDFYNSKGYRNAYIVDDSVYNLTVDRLGIDISLSEGNKYYFRNITWIGNAVLPVEALNLLLGVNEGDLYDRKTLHKRLGVGAESSPDDNSIMSWYQNRGYLFSSIEPSEVVIGADSIDLEIRVFEGKQAIINRVEITGNQRVDDEVIRRELYTQPGDLYNRSMLMSTLRQLMQMKHFSPEKLQPQISPVSSELVDITFPLEEMASDQFEFSFGWGYGSFILSAGIQLNNLSVKRIFEKGAWRPYPSGQNQSLSFRAQTNGKYYKAFSANFIEPWMGGKKPVSLSIGAHYSDETDASIFYEKATRYFRTLGVSAGIGRRLSWPDPNFTLYTELGYSAYILKDWTNFVVENGSSNMMVFTATLGRQTLDGWATYPEDGSNFLLTMSLTPPYSLFDSRDYSEEMSDRAKYGWIEYHKWKFKGEWYTSLTKGTNKLVLMTKVELGYLGHYDKNRQSPFEGFDVGGSGMTGYNLYGVDVVGLRGYEDSSITPYSESGREYARAYSKFTVELRYPFVLQASSQIYGLIFAEGGNGFRDWEEFNPFHLKRSLGAGIRVNLSIIGMLGFDWGYGFDAPVGSNKPHKGQFTFTFGQQF